MRARAALAGLAAALVVLAAALPAGAAYAPPPNIAWESLLPPLRTAQNPQPHPIYGCRRQTIKCIDYEIARMRQIRNGLRCDHRAVFATTYLRLTQALRAKMLHDPHFQRDPKWLYAEDSTFANMYFGSIARDERGQRVPAAWQIAFDTARKGDANAVQDMLLGINAHVQRDMPFMLASVGLRDRHGVSHKPDHDAINQVLDEAFKPVVDTIAHDFDPTADLMSPGFNVALGYAGNLTGEELVKVWREQVWRNAERLLNARTSSELAGVEAGIEQNAALTAESIAAFPMPPGYRAQRDAYCRAHLASRKP